MYQWQLVNDTQSNAVWMSGPHLGVISDIKLASLYSPPYELGEKCLADLAYTGSALPNFMCVYFVASSDWYFSLYNRMPTAPI